MVAALNTDYGTGEYVAQQTRKPAPFYTALSIVLDARQDTVTRHLQAHDGALRETFALSQRFVNAAAAIAFYAALGFHVNKARSKRGVVVLEAKARYVNAPTPDDVSTHKYDWRAEGLARKHKRDEQPPPPRKPRKAAVCRVCGGPRDLDIQYALCHVHYLQNNAKYSREAQRRRKAKEAQHAG